MEANTVSAIAASASALIAGAALVAALLQVRHLARQIAGDHDWKRREKAFQYSQVHHLAVKAARERLATLFSNLPAQGPGLALSAAAEMDATIDADLRTILIYLENIGLAVQHNVADFTVLYDMNGNDTIRFYEISRDYIEARRAEARNPRL